MITSGSGPRAVAAALLVLIVAVGCSPVPEIGDATTEEVYALGASAATRGDHLFAIEAMTRVLSRSPLHELADDALLALARSHQAMGEYALAEEEYSRLASDYPRSPLVPEAAHGLGLTYFDQSLPAALDQTMTERAIAQFERFASDHPGSPLVADARRKVAELRSRLAEKTYRGAELYLKLENGSAARVYFEAVARDYADTPWAPRALLALARSAAADGLTDEANAARARLVELYPDSDEARAALETSAP